MHSHSDLKSRLFDIASLDTPTRRIVWVGYALLVGIAVSAAVRDFLPGQPVRIDPGYVAPLAIVAIAGATLCVAVALLLAGASLARSSWRFLALPMLFLLGAAIEFAAIVAVQIPMPVSLVFTIAGAALLIFGWPLSLRKVLGFSVGLVTLVAAAALLESTIGRETYAATLVFVVLAILVVIVMPVLIVVGWDFAEIAEEVTSAILQRDSAPLDSTIYVPALLASAALAMGLWLGVELAETGIVTLLLRAAALVVLGGAFVWHILSRPAAHATAQTEGVRYLLMLAIGVVIAIAGWNARIFTTAEHGALNYNTSHRFSVMMPAGWRVDSKLSDPDDGLRDYRSDLLVVLAPTDKPLPHVIIKAIPRDQPGKVQPTTVNEVANAHSLPVMPLHIESLQEKKCKCGETVVTNARGKRLHFAYKVLETKTNTPASNKNWYLVSVTPEATDPKLAAGAKAIVDSFRLHARSVPNPDVHVLNNEIFWILLGALAVVLGARQTKRRPVWDFLAWTSIVLFVRNALTVGMHFHNMEAADAAELSGGVISAALIAGASVLIGSALIAHRGGARARALCTTAVPFLTSLLMLGGIFALYVYAAKGSEFSHAVRGAVICVALSWELFSSGALITNKDTTTFPRRARVLFFLGYIMLIATIVFFFGRLEYAAAHTEQLPFESELYIATGMACLGLPFLIFRHVERFAAMVRRADVELKAEAGDTTSD